MRRFGCILVIACCVGASMRSRAGEVDFNRDVKPSLAQNCFACHGPDAEKREAELRLDTEGGAKGEREGKRAVVPGDLERSELVRRILSESPKKRMPPPDSGKKLTAEQIAMLQQWVKQGAVWGQHWAFLPPKRPAAPVVKDVAWPVSPIDAFVLARLEKEGLHPSAAADRSTLIRRVSLDLTGLPPTPGLMDAFVKDESPQAYERLVDRFLASPGYGEKWALVWLDLARYADTKGYEKDRRREMWPYRDWLIGAINGDMPFGQFTIEQLAGDLLANPTQSQLIATAFNRNTMTNQEGGVDAEEFRIVAVKDRVDTTVQVWMGLTMGCAKCHSHKYDPITQREYYQFLAFFDQSEDANRGNEAPTIPVLADEDKRQNDLIHAQIAPLKKRLDTQTPELDSAMERWEKGLGDSEANPKLPALPAEIAAIVALPSDERTEAHRTKLAAHFRSIAPELEPLRAQMEQLRKKLIVPVPLPVMRDLPIAKKRITHIHNRGSFLDPGEAVEPVVLGSLHPWPADAPKNRLGMAQWIVSTDNPLTARVLVNRYWAQFFGTGIVETEEDFGTQGQPPSHPELLDWLTTEFTRGGGSMKALCKTIVMSSTYRQSSRVSADLIAKDRFNRLLARGPRVRLDAEAVRDNALAISGLLSPKVGGPSVMPYQPDGIWASVYSTEKWITSPGEDRHRRGLYTFVKRTSPYPSMLAFDGTSRETCTVRRITTNTPLQSLVTMNDPVYVEAAQALARKVMAEGGPTVAARAGFAIRQALLRSATSQEIEKLARLHGSRLAWYADHLEEAAKFATNPIGALPADVPAQEAAAWTSVCNVVLNLDETLTKQ